MRSRLARTIGAVVCAAVLMQACGGGAGLKEPGLKEPGPVDDATALHFRSGMNDFSFELHRRAVPLAEGKGNLVLGGYSVGIAMAMATGGTSGTTSSEFLEALHLGAMTQEDVHRAAAAVTWELQQRSVGGQNLKVANTMFVQDGESLKGTFEKLTEKYYGVRPGRVDFKGDGAGASETVRRWISDNTDGFLPGVDVKFKQNTGLALVNAVYFDGKWVDKFDEGQMAFYHDDGTKSTVDSLYKDNVTRQVGYVGDTDVVRMPYIGDEENPISMIIAVPEEGGLGALEAELSNGWLADAVRSLESCDDHYLKMPAWSFENSFDLRKALVDMGMPDVHDLSEIFDNRDPRRRDTIDQIAHAAKIEVTAEGTTVAAATVVSDLVNVSYREPCRDVTANRPFVYMIRDDTTGMILFTGRVVDPS